MTSYPHAVHVHGCTGFQMVKVFVVVCQQMCIVVETVLFLHIQLVAVAEVLKDEQKREWYVQSDHKC